MLELLFCQDKNDAMYVLDKNNKWKYIGFELGGEDETAGKY